MTKTAPTTAGGVGSGRLRRLPRTLACVLCFVLAGLLVPASVTAVWARATVLDTDGFVSAYAGLVDDPAVQDAVSAQVSSAIEEGVDVDGVVARAADAITAGLPDRAAGAVQDLVGPAQLAVRALIEREIHAYVASDRFAAVWRGTLRTAHGQLIRVLEGDASSLIVVDGSGEVSVQLQPIVAAVRDRLVTGGLTIAGSLPDTDARIEVARITAFPAIVAGYRAVLAAGLILPWLTLLLLAAGVVAARRRRRGLVIAAAVTAGAALVPELVLVIGRDALVGAVQGPGLSRGALTSVMNAVLGPIQVSLLIVLIVSLVALALALLAPRLRRLARAVRARLARRAAPAA